MHFRLLFMSYYCMGDVRDAYYIYRCIIRWMELFKWTHHLCERALGFNSFRYPCESISFVVHKPQNVYDTVFVIQYTHTIFLTLHIYSNKNCILHTILFVAMQVDSFHSLLLFFLYIQCSILFSSFYFHWSLSHQLQA